MGGLLIMARFSAGSYSPSSSNMALSNTGYNLSDVTMSWGDNFALNSTNIGNFSYVSADRFPISNEMRLGEMFDVEMTYDNSLSIEAKQVQEQVVKPVARSPLGFFAHNIRNAFVRFPGGNIKAKNIASLYLDPNEKSDSDASKPTLEDINTGNYYLASSLDLTLESKTIKPITFNQIATESLEGTSDGGCGLDQGFFSKNDQSLYPTWQEVGNKAYEKIGIDNFASGALYAFLYGDPTDLPNIIGIDLDTNKAVLFKREVEMSLEERYQRIATVIKLDCQKAREEGYTISPIPWSKKILQAMIRKLNDHVFVDLENDLEHPHYNKEEFLNFVTDLRDSIVTANRYLVTFFNSEEPNHHVNNKLATEYLTQGFRHTVRPGN